MKLLLASISVIALLAVAGAIWVGVRSFDGTVTEHAYEKGLAWDEMERAKRELGWHVEISSREFIMGDNELAVAVSAGNGHPLSGAEVFFKVSRPSSGDYDREYDTEKVREGFFTSPVLFPLYGQWDVNVRVIKGKNDIVFQNRIFVKKEV